MTERETGSQERVQIVAGATPVDCYLDNHFTRRITGVGFRVILDGEIVWEKREFPNFFTSMIGYLPKPFYEARIQRARKKASKVANNIKASL